MNENQEHQDSACKTHPRRIRKSTQERLDLALAKMQTLQTRIDGLRTVISQKSKAARNRQLILAGIVLEKLFRNRTFSAGAEYPPDWWRNQAALLAEKDREAYLDFVAECVEDWQKTQTDSMHCLPDRIV